MNTKLAIDKPIADMWQIFVDFLLDYFDITVLVH